MTCMRIATWNVNSLNVRLPHLEQWLEQMQPDVVALQETKLEDTRFPDAALAVLGYRSVFSGQKTYNGVALLVRGQAVEDVRRAIPGVADDQKRVIAATVGDLRIVNLYVVNGQALGTEKYAWKLHWLDAVHDWLAEEIRRHPRLIVLGDFNIAPEERDVHDPQVWNDSHILTSSAERAALHRLCALGLTDAFRQHEPAGDFYSWWDYRQASFRRNLGLRIDLILVSDALTLEITAAGIDRTPRTWERPSDHAPVWVDVQSGKTPAARDT